MRRRMPPMCRILQANGLGNIHISISLAQSRWLGLISCLALPPVFTQLYRLTGIKRRANVGFTKNGYLQRFRNFVV
jgi:hypothetical protein